MRLRLMDERFQRRSIGQVGRLPPRLVQFDRRIPRRRPRQGLRRLSVLSDTGDA